MCRPLSGYTPVMTDHEHTHEDSDAETAPGKTVQEEMPDPEQMPGGKTGRQEGEGKPGPKDPGTTRDVTGA